MKKLISLTILSTILICFVARATSLDEVRQSALDFGSSYKNSASTIVTDQNKQNTPGYTTDNPEETKYYEGGAMSDDALAKSKNSEEGRLMIEGLPNRPQVNLSPGDDFLNSSQAIESNPDQVVAMLTGTYGECKPIEHTVTENEIKTCDQFEQTDCVDGKKLVNVTSLSNASWNFPYLIMDISRRGGGPCSKYYANTTINILDTSKITNFVLEYVRWDDIIEIKVNGNIIFSHGNMNARSCELAVDYRSSPNVNLKPYLINGNNTIELTLGVSGLGNATARFQLAYQNNLICPIIDNCTSIPSHCSFEGSKCLNFSSDNLCNYTQKTYICSKTTITSTASVECGSNIYCVNNQCTQIEEDGNQDFATSISYLTALNQASKDNNANSENLKIFSGEAKNCQKDTISYNNCCKDDGWGQDVSGSSCSAEEKTLMELQSTKMCHYVGSYCSQKIPLTGKCLKTKKTYCCYNSKISRIITQQGRAQLGKGWGSAESPNCEGFTTDELSRLRFDQMNLSEIASDISESVVMPDKAYLETKIEQTMEGYGQTSN